MDTLRVRMQQARGAAAGGGGALAAVRAAMSSEGVGARALYRGLSYPLLSSALQSAVMFQAYGAALRLLQSSSSSASSSPGGAPPGLGAVYLAGCVSGAAQATFMVPIELLKIKLQLQTAAPGSPGYRGPLAMAAALLRADGPAGLFRGTSITVLRDVPSFGAYFAVYHGGCAALGAPDSAAAPPGVQLAAGGIAGVVSWAVIYPLDVIKTRCQAAEGPRVGWLAAAAGAWRAEGAAPFLRGLQPTLGRALVVNAVTFAGFEGLMRLLLPPAAAAPSLA
jgi:hypothetical protein